MNVIIWILAVIMLFCLVYDDVGCPELLQIVRINDGEADISNN